MKNNLKRYLAILIAVTLAVGCLPGNLQRKFGVQPGVKAEETINNPMIVADSSMEAGQKVTWDCVWFGSYPQTEIVDKAETCGTYGEKWEIVSDYEVDASTYSALQSASGWNSNGDITLPDGKKYRRIKKSDATILLFFNWIDSDTYHYFRYDPIKWRVLDRDGSIALLLADKTLDDQKYHIVDESVTWETSTIRSWLNGYGASSNKRSVDYTSKNFVDAAFTSAQQEGILRSTLSNADNIKNGTDGGNDTNDRIFLLSESEVYTDTAKSYGFVSGNDVREEARRCKASIYAVAMGTEIYRGSSYAGNCYWMLRSPGYSTDFATNVYQDGYVTQDGWYVNHERFGIRPALRLNLAESDLWSYAGTICSIEEKVKKEKEDIIDIKKITLTGISKKIARGKKIKLTADVLPKNASNKKLKWSTSNKKLATVTQTGLVKIAKKATPGKTVKITATATDGSGKKQIWAIKIMKGAVKKIIVKGYKKTLKAGKTMKLKAVVKTTKGKPVNKKLKWTSLSPKYATVTQTGKVKAKPAGKGKTVKIKIQSTDGTNKSVVKKIKIK